MQASRKIGAQNHRSKAIIRYDSQVTGTDLWKHKNGTIGKSDWFFAVTAFNSSGIESSYSAEVFKTIKLVARNLS